MPGLNPRNSFPFSPAFLAGEEVKGAGGSQGSCHVSDRNRVWEKDKLCPYTGSLSPDSGDIGLFMECYLEAVYAWEGGCLFTHRGADESNRVGGEYSHPGRQASWGLPPISALPPLLRLTILISPSSWLD